MQEISVISVQQSFDCGSASKFAEIEGKFSEDFTGKLKVTEETQNEEKPSLPQEEEEDDEEEFSFVCTNPDGSPISADVIFLDGQIRPVFPLFNQDLLFAAVDDEEEDEDLMKSRISTTTTNTNSVLRSPLKKLFVEERNDDDDDDNASSSTSEPNEPEGPYCVWTGKAVEASSPREGCRKSNSTGFSKLWRFRERVLRSNSDGKDAFVFLHNHKNHNHSHNLLITTPTTTTATTVTTATNTKANKGENKIKSGKVVIDKKKKKVVKSAHEKHYMKNRAMKEGDKRRSYLPYRQDIVGFFTNVNGLSRNVHPF